MRNIILNLAISLDGYIEGPAGEFDWCFTDQDYGMGDFLAGVDTVVFGRKSYELMLRMDGSFAADKRRIVCSHTLDAVAPGWELLPGDAAASLPQIKAAPGRDIWLFGGAELAQALLSAGLVDEMLLSVHPLLLGGGKRLFDAAPTRIPLRLVAQDSYASGLLQVRYACG
ncbi:MAG: dihydrofolate reductase family protein [Bacteroidia bacterium]